MDGDGASAVDEEIFDGLSALVTLLIGRAERVARQFGVPPFFLKALHLLDGPTAMKDLGKRMRCDPSFVTSIADQMEERGLATREPDPADRRVRRIALTPAGLELKARAEAEIVGCTPWRRSLEEHERACLLGLIRKMVAAAAADPAEPSAVLLKEVSARLSAPAGTDT